MDYLHTRACGVRKGVGVACVAGYASNAGNTYTEKAREVGLAQEKRIIHKPCLLGCPSVFASMRKTTETSSAVFELGTL